MRNVSTTFLTAALLLAALSAPVHAASTRGDSTLLVIPARYQMVQLAMDLKRISGADIVSYQKPSQADDIRLHLWRGGNWQPVGEEDYKIGAIPGVPSVDGAYVIGVQPAVVDSLMAVSTWAKSASSIETLNISSILNTLTQPLGLKSRDLKWLAGRYDLKIEDRNYERRRYGRYGRSGSVTPKPAPVVETPAPRRLAPLVVPDDIDEPEALEPVVEKPVVRTPVVHTPIIVVETPEKGAAPSIEVETPKPVEVPKAIEAAEPKTVEMPAPAAPAGLLDDDLGDVKPAIPAPDTEPDASAK